MCNNNSNNYNKDVQTHMYTRCKGKKCNVLPDDY